MVLAIRCCDQSTSAGKVGYQYKFIQNDAESLWMQEKIESQNQKEFTTDEKKAIMTELVKTDGFEQFLQKKYPAEKRFGTVTSTSFGGHFYLQRHTAPSTAV